MQEFHQLSGLEATEEFRAAVERQQAGPDRAFGPFHPLLDAFQLKSLTGNQLAIRILGPRLILLSFAGQAQRLGLPRDYRSRPIWMPLAQRISCAAGAVSPIAVAGPQQLEILWRPVVARVGKPFRFVSAR
jgi:hypothetical protein